MGKRKAATVLGTPEKTEKYRLPFAREYADLLKAIPRAFVRVSPECVAMLRESLRGGKVGVSANAYVHVYQPEPGLWLCGCEKMKEARDLYLAIQGPIHAQDLEDLRGKECLHAECMRVIGRRRIVDPVKKVDDRVTVLGENIFSFHSRGFPGRFERTCVLVNDQKQYLCAEPWCTKIRNFCYHVAGPTDKWTHGFAAYLEEKSLHTEDAFENLEAQGKDYVRPVLPPAAVPVCASTTPIRIDALVDAVAERCGPDGCRPWPRECVASVVGRCRACGAAWSDETRIVCNRAVLIGMDRTARGIVVRERKCSACDVWKRYDGNEDGVFNYSDRIMFLHEVMLGYVDTLTELRTTLNGYFDIVERRHERTSEPVGCDPKTFIKACGAFVDLVGVDYKAAFCCPACDKIPMSERVMVFDGKAIGHKRHLSLPLEPDVLAADKMKARVLHGNNFILIKGTDGDVAEYGKLRSLVHWYAENRDPDHPKDDKSTFPHEKFSAQGCKARAILNLTRKLQLPGLTTFFEYIRKCNPDTYNVCPLPFRHFLTDISSEFSVSTMMDPKLYAGESGGVISRIIDETGRLSIEDKDMLAQWPSLSKMVLGMRWVVIPEEVKRVLRELVVIARIPGKILEDMDGIKVSSDDQTSYAFFPNFPIVRPGKTYANTPDQSTECVKIVKMAPSFTSGILTMICPHGVCLGFEAMRKFEGPSSVFDVVRARFPVAPGVIIYDNACNLSRYCMKREPGYFSMTRFWIDRLHWKGHINCHHGFCMDEYPKCTPVMDSTIRDVNSQVCEQTNAKLELIAKTTAFMGQRSYMRTVSLFLALLNIEKLNGRSAL